MCGRFTLLTSAETLQQTFDLAEVPPLVPRYNIAPTQQVAAIRVTEGHASWCCCAGVWSRPGRTAPPLALACSMPGQRPWPRNRPSARPCGSAAA